MPSSHISAPVDFAKSIDKTSIKDKTALVTGGSSGIGAGISKSLAEAGAAVTIVDLNAEAGEKYAAELAKNGLRVRFAQADVSNWQQMLDAFRECIRDSPNKTIDIVIACAGINGVSFLQDGPFATHEGTEDPPPPSLNVVNVNLIGSLYTAALAVYYFRKTAKSPDEFAKANKQLTLIASNIAYFPIQLFSTYTASKIGVRGLWQSLRESTDLTGMRTNLVAPHIVRSPMTKDYAPTLEANGIQLAEVSEIVDVLMRMVCDESIRGRAVAVYPGAAYDTHDTLEEHEEAKQYAKDHEPHGKDLWAFMENMLRTGVQPGGQHA